MLIFCSSNGSSSVNSIMRLHEKHALPSEEFGSTENKTST